MGVFEESNPNFRVVSEFDGTNTIVILYIHGGGIIGALNIDLKDLMNVN